MKKLLLAVTIILLFLTGCNHVKKEYITPERYYAEALVGTHNSLNNREINYNLKILQKDNECKLIIDHNDITFLVQFNDGKCTLINDKFPDSEITTTMPALEKLYKEISLDKFNGLKSIGPNTVEAYDSEYKYVLQYDKKTFAPQKLNIYKKNLIIKTFEYKNVELYRH